MDFYASAGEGAAREVGFFGFGVLDGAVDSGVNGEVAGEEGAWTGYFGATSLTDEDFASFDFCATKAFDAKALACIVVNIFGGTAGFDM